MMHVDEKDIHHLAAIRIMSSGLAQVNPQNAFLMQLVGVSMDRYKHGPFVTDDEGRKHAEANFFTVWLTTREAMAQLIAMAILRCSQMGDLKEFEELISDQLHDLTSIKEIICLCGYEATTLRKGIPWCGICEMTPPESVNNGEILVRLFERPA